MTKPLISLAILLALTGCGSMSAPGYECALEDSPQGKCASMADAYAATKRADPKAKSVSVFDAKARTDVREENKPFFLGRESEMPEPGQQGMPVFNQPKVHRVWVAPYVDADGNLRTGEYTYFNTPGKWNYGTTRTPGAAAGVFGPAKPNQNLGFTPNDKKPVTPPAAGTKPAAPPNAPATAPAPGNVKPAAGNNITQPYQKLTD